MTPEQIKQIETLRTLLNKRDLAQKRLAKTQAELEHIEKELLPYLK